MQQQTLLNLTFGVTLLALVVKTQFVDSKTDSHAQLHVKELTTEKITVLERDGQRRLQIANSHYSPPVVVNGQTLFDPGPRPGLIFFNDEGTENGGLIFMGKQVDGKVRHGVHLSMDRYNQDQAVALQHIEQDGQIISGLNIIDRPALSLDKYMQLARQAEAKDPQAIAELEVLQKGSAQNIHGARRAFYGTLNDQALLQLNDGNGKKRIELLVGAKGDPQLVFYREDGSILQKLPQTPLDKTTADAHGS